MESTSRSGSSSRHREGDYKATRDRSRERNQDRDRNRERERDSERRHRNRDRGSGGSDDEKGDHSSHHKKHKSSSSSKSRHHEREEGRDHHRRHHKPSSRHDKDRDRKSSRSSHHKGGSDSDSVKDKDGVAMDLEEEDMWVEKEVPGVDSTPVQVEPKETASSIEPAYEKPQLESKRDAWMMSDGSLDFGMMGSAKVKKSKEDTANPDQVRFVVSDRELNPHLKEGGIIEGQPVAAKPSYTIGDAGSSWRMTKLRRVMEQAAEQGVASEVIGIQRYGSIDKYNEALEERKELDRRMSRRGDRRGDGRRDDRREGNDRRKGDDRDSERDRDGRRRNDRDRERTNDSDYDSDRRRRRDDWSSRLGGGGGYLSELSSAASSPFRRPMDEQERQERELARRQRDKEREETQQQEKRYTPIQSPFVTHVSSPLPHQTPADTPQVDDAPTLDQLNKLRAKSIRAKMLGTPDAETLEQEYEKAQKAFNEAASRPQPPPQQQQPQADSANRVVIVQTMGRSSGSASPVPLGPGNSKGSGRNKKDKTHDDAGNRIAYQGEEGDVDIHELVRREKMGLEEGMDRELARRITRDAVFKDDLDYMDDNADKIARTVKKSDMQLKNVAINDYKRTQSALDRCQQCFKDDGRNPPIMPIVSMGTRVYLGLPLTKDFVPGHCMIVPVQHVTSTLECDDDAWDEIRNFMKCLIQMNAAEDRAVIFSETVTNLGWQKHAMIECIPVPWQAGKAAPGFFKEAILNADEEWAQHKKLIETDAKDSSNGGFRRRLTSKLPYFHVWFGSPDKGFGHVIEDSDRFPDYFVKEVVASICEMDSIEWRSKKRDRQVKYSENENKRRLDQFRKLWQAWDWTRAIEGRKSE
ncbi:hypothetical protein BGW38_004987 [Lunasporangiospora selenospora]|uniref:Uncharacterized protein n=1 Tax=Lunasporangiospora selenospora TaxID=979761 RepID=A0A9P6G0L9_9FUNG|nr:hypothetical protein BGW38_004987 [Lunasporangiospora selenospora]